MSNTPCPDMLLLAAILEHDIVMDVQNVMRWKENKALRLWTSNTHTFSMNDLWKAYDFSRQDALEDMMKFYMMMGYSLSGFGEVFGQREVTSWGLDYIDQPPADWDFDNHYWETPIDHILRKHAAVRRK